MKSRMFKWLGAVLGACATTLTAPAQSYLFTSSSIPPNTYTVNGVAGNPRLTLTGGVGYGVTISANSGHPIFFTAASSPTPSSPNYYSVNPGAYSSPTMASPTTSASLTFTPAISNAIYNLYYVDASTSGPYGTMEIDPPTFTPDTTSTISISRPIVPTNGPGTVTVVPRSGGAIINSSSSFFSMSVSAGGGTISGLSPATGTNFTAAYTASTNTGAFTISDGLGATVPVSVIRTIPLLSFTISNRLGGPPRLTAQGFSNCTYQVIMTTNFISWTGLGSVTSSSNGVLQFTDTSAPYPSKRFYRLSYP